ncbi:DUF2079 domain-containing protein [Longispora fulva]|uniref:Uncharacterized protein n=1 Tax=Longispora fulva TaxID=619741 RepID=A0A8J7GC19_9ACTN|nr:DUF2079 domain-containing protein [Longispora fulva]MBG6134801.1 hypothetical protein [Longispora fulva]
MRTTGYDLGIFEQAIRGYAEGRAPVSELKGPGFHLLGDHFHPVLMLLAPVYRLFPGPLTLLVAQAALFAVSAVPVTRLAVMVVGRWRGLGLGVAYGLSWGVQQAVDFDFHEIAFAVPLLAFSLDALATGRWRRAALFALPLLLVKEDLGLTVAAIGICLACRGTHVRDTWRAFRAGGVSPVLRQRLLGGALVATGVAGTLLTVLVLIPAFNPAGDYAYTATAGRPLAGLDAKEWLLFALLAPTLFLAVRSPLVLVAVPTVALRLWSGTPNHWSTGFHYDAVLMPVLFVALVDALSRLRPAPAGRLAVAACALGCAIGAFQPLAGLAHPATWRVPPHVAAVRSALDGIPDGAVVAADNRLAPQLTARCQVYRHPEVPPGVHPDWIATTDPDVRPPDGYEVAHRAPGLTLLRRSPISDPPHPPNVHSVPSATTITQGVTFEAAPA